jgi:hypothetical protein
MSLMNDIRTLNMAHHANQHPAVSGFGDRMIPQRLPGIPCFTDISKLDEDVPAYACMAVVDVKYDETTDSYSLKVVKPDNDTSDGYFYRRYYVFNGDQPISKSGDGRGTCFDGSDGPCKILLDDYTDAGYGTEMGYVPGQWYVKPGYPAVARCLASALDAAQNIALAAVHPIEQIAFELKGDKVPGTWCDAYWLRPSTTDPSGYEPNTEAQYFLVSDQLNGKQWRAKGRTTLNSSNSPTGRHGACGIASWNPTTNRYEIVQMQEQAKRIRGILTSDVNHSNGGTIKNVAPIDGGQMPVVSSDDTHTLNLIFLSPCNIWIASGSTVEAEWIEDGSQSTYRITSPNQQCRFCYGTLGANIQLDSVWATASDATGLDGTLPGGVSSCSFGNPLRLRGNSGQKFVAILNGRFGNSSFGIGYEYDLIAVVPDYLQPSFTVTINGQAYGVIPDGYRWLQGIGS